MSDLTTMSDEALSNHLNAVLAEQERRADLARIPDAMASMQAKFISGGGDPAVIAAALDPQAE